MPTVISHPAVALATAPGLGIVKRKALVVVSGMILTALPDLDVLAFRAGIPYDHIFGHRGFSHSILFALLISLLFAFLKRLCVMAHNRCYGLPIIMSVQDLKGPEHWEGRGSGGT